MPGFNDYHSFKSTSGGSSNGSGHKGDGFGCGWVIIVIVAIFLCFFIVDGASWDAIDTLLGLGLIAFFVAKSMF